VENRESVAASSLKDHSPFPSVGNGEPIGRVAYPRSALSARAEQIG
jgi:hypothetical protein